MGKINWKVRIRNKQFWLGIIPVIFLLIQQVLAVFGIVTDFTNLQNQLVAIVGTVFALLAGLGVIVDNTTVGIFDSERALSYDEPSINYDEFDSDVDDSIDDLDDEEIEIEEIE